MTPLVAVASIFLAVAVYACIGFWRYKAIDMVTLADYELLPDAATLGGDVAVIAGVVVLAAVIFTLGHFGYPNLQGLVWAGTAIAVLSFLAMKSFLPSRCETCAGPVRYFRKPHRASVPAIVHVKICDHCKTYREEAVLA